MKRYISKEELNQRIKLNRDRLTDEYYGIENVFDIGSDWPGDKAGRALLAFVSHYKINQSKNPCMDKMMDEIPSVTEGRMYFGDRTGEVIFEQQLSGHSWYLRGLCEYYEQFHDDRALDYMKKTVEELYLPTKNRFDTYPIDRDYDDGGVSGHSYDVLNGWKLSTDVGCAFMSIDGLSHYYELTKDEAVKELLDEMISRFMSIDKIKIQAQTHCTLTAARGMVRLYKVTLDVDYLDKAEEIFWLYARQGMTFAYQNFNWFGKGNTWTEPCAIVDSLLLAGMLYELTGNSDYRSYAARIYFNGLATAQRPNGGAGTDSTVSSTMPILKMDGYEAMFCCTMRLAEGLWYVYNNCDILYANTNGKVEKDATGRYFDGDILYGQIVSSDELAEENKDSESAKACETEEKMESESAGICETEEKISVDGYLLQPVVEFYKLKDEQECRNICQRIIF